MNTFWYLAAVMDLLNYGTLEQLISLRSAVLKSTITKFMLLIGIYKCVTAISIITSLLAHINYWLQRQTKDNFVSGSWDDSIRVWSPLKPRSLQTYREHRWVYNAIHIGTVEYWLIHRSDIVSTPLYTRRTSRHCSPLRQVITRSKCGTCAVSTECSHVDKYSQ